MELKQIRYFEVVCKHKSISKAAAELYVTQQGVSRQIQNLESELDAKLFERTSQGVELTDEGHYFHEQAAIILQTQHDIVEHFSMAHKQKNLTLRVGVSHGLRFFFDERFFEGFSKQCPQFQVQSLALWNPQTEDNVMNNTIDIGFTLAPVKFPELKQEVIIREPLYCIVNDKSPLADKEYLTIDDIFQCRIAMADENYNSYHRFKKLCEDKNVQPETHKMFDLLSIYNFVLHNENAVGFTLKSYSNYLRFDHIRYIPLQDLNAYWEICLVWKGDKKKHRIQKFVEYTREQAALFSINEKNKSP
jgi:DNA-binding transcriptional LysR family regulator